MNPGSRIPQFICLLPFPLLVRFKLQAGLGLRKFLLGPTPPARRRRGVASGMADTLILDIDGTLVDSNDAGARAWVRALAAQGVTVTFEHIRPFIGMGGDQLLPAATGIEQDDSRFKAASDAWKREFTKELPGVRAFPGTRDLVQAAQQAGWRTVVATSGDPELAEELLKIAHVDDLLPDRVSSADADASKPHPDIIQVALEKVGAQPQDAWMLGDTVYDMQAAHRAGVKGAFVRVGQNPDPEEADRLFDDLGGVQQLFR